MNFVQRGHSRRPQLEEQSARVPQAYDATALLDSRSVFRYHVKYLSSVISTAATVEHSVRRWGMTASLLFSAIHYNQEMRLTGSDAV